MTALLAHADAARCMAQGLNESAKRMVERAKEKPSIQPECKNAAVTLVALSDGYAYAADLMEAEARRQLGANTETPCTPLTDEA